MAAQDVETNGLQPSDATDRVQRRKPPALRTPFITTLLATFVVVGYMLLTNASCWARAFMVGWVGITALVMLCLFVTMARSSWKAHNPTPSPTSKTLIEKCREKHAKKQASEE